MKKNLFLALACVLLFFASCQKETLLLEQTPVTSDNGMQSVQLLNKEGIQKDQCRLIYLNTNFGFTSTFVYNQMKLAESWSLSWDQNQNTDLGLFEYNEKGILIKAKYDFNGVPYSDAHIEYDRNGRVKRTIWYEPNTTNIVDEVHYIYNSQGYMLRQQSFMWGIDVRITPDTRGNYDRIDFYINDILVQSSIYTHNVSNRNPFTAISGQPFNLLYYGFIFSKWWETSESIIFYDENGDPFYLWDQDPSKTVLSTGMQNLLTVGKFYDRTSGDLFHYWFEYDCGNNFKNNIPVKPIQRSSGSVQNRKSELMKIMTRHGKAFRDGLLQFRNDAIKKRK
jgi:hypothetical protein